MISVMMPIKISLSMLFLQGTTKKVYKTFATGKEFCLNSHVFLKFLSIFFPNFWKNIDQKQLQMIISKSTLKKYAQKALF